MSADEFIDNVTRCTCSRPSSFMSRVLNPACPVHGWEGDEDAECGREIAETDAVRAEHRP